jgi:NADPH:quinone reductase-like Zn-dependent oxidoreductase
MAHSKTMKGVLIKGFGGFEQLEYREDLPIPTPEFDEVLIKVGACGINNTDIWTRQGAYGNSVDDQAESGWRGGAFQFPRIQGADIVGELVETGDGVDPLRLHQRVIVNPALYQGDDMQGLYEAGLIGSEMDGGFAEFVAVPEPCAIAIQSPLTDAELATFMVSYLTAEHMLNRARVRQGDRVLITGSSGGVGSALVQLAKRRNAQVIAIVGKGKENPVMAIGADAILHRGEIIQTELQRLGLETVDVVADVVAGLQSSELLDVLSIGGRFVIAGAIAGAITEIDWRKIYLKHLDVLGSTMGTATEANDLVRYIADGEIKPLLAQTFQLDQIVEAQQTFLQKQFFGKLAIVP